MADDRRRSLLSLIALDVMAGERPNELQSWFTALADDVRLVLESENPGLPDTACSLVNNSSLSSVIRFFSFATCCLHDGHR